MRVYTEDITRLFYKAIEKFENQKHIRLGDVNNSDFFKEFTLYLNAKTKSNLSYETLHKQYYIRLKSYQLPEIGFSTNYLNALSQFVHESDFIQNYSMSVTDEEEIPEFPYLPQIACFPATPAIPINIPGFSNVWIKDESCNPTGVHKDRLAWEIYLFYDKYIKEQWEAGGRIQIPHLSLISSGNAALSIQYLLHLKGLPNLKVILDKSTDDNLQKAVRNSGCEIFLYDLESNRLTSEEILEFTNNKNGYDLTYGEKVEDIKLTYYDWLSYEILNLNPHSVFVPYGSGDLYRNIIEIFQTETKTKRTSKRFFGNKNILSKCNFYGATALDKHSRMKMLYAPFNSYKENDMKNIFESGVIGSSSNIYPVKEEQFLQTALDFAQKNGIETEASGIAGLALFFQKEKDLDPNAKHVIVNTGKIKLELFS